MDYMDYQMMDIIKFFIFYYFLHQLDKNYIGSNCCFRFHSEAHLNEFNLMFIQCIVLLCNSTYMNSTLLGMNTTLLDSCSVEFMPSNVEVIPSSVASALHYLKTMDSLNNTKYPKCVIYM